MSEPQMLPIELEAVMASDQADGVMYRRERDKGVTGIVWRPGDRNMLVQAICDHVGTDPMPLELAGHQFEIRRLP
jgi:hypothetical protein